MESAVAQIDRSQAGRAAGVKSGRRAAARGGRTLVHGMRVVVACRG